MSSNILWTPGYGASQTLATTALNSLANGSQVTCTELDNSNGGAAGKSWPFGDFVLFLSGGVTAGSGGTLTLYLTRAPDGTNYPDQVTSNLLIDTLQFSSGTLTRIVWPQVMLPPAKFKPIIVNGLGVSFPSASNTLILYPYNQQIV